MHELFIQTNCGCVYKNNFILYIGLVWKLFSLKSEEIVHSSRSLALFTLYVIKSLICIAQNSHIPCMSAMRSVCEFYVTSMI